MIICFTVKKKRPRLLLLIAIRRRKVFKLAHYVVLEALPSFSSLQCVPLRDTHTRKGSFDLRLARQLSIVEHFQLSILKMVCGIFSLYCQLPYSWAVRQVGDLSSRKCDLIMASLGWPRTWRKNPPTVCQTAQEYGSWR